MLGADNGKALHAGATCLALALAISHIWCSPSPLSHLPLYPTPALDEDHPPKLNISCKAPPSLCIPCSRTQEARGGDL